MPPADPERVDGVERQLGVELPADYRALLARSNGGYLEGNALAPGTDYSIRQLFSAGEVDDPDTEDLQSMATFYHEQADYPLPERLLPIGEDEGGNVIALQTDTEDHGAVWFWTHDAPEGEDGLTRIADSFGQFFERLRPY